MQVPAPRPSRSPFRPHHDQPTTRWETSQPTGRSAVHPDVSSDVSTVTTGALVIHDRRAWRVISVKETPLANWPTQYEDLYAEEAAARQSENLNEIPEHTKWNHRPVTLSIAPATSPHVAPLHLITPASHIWATLPEHHSVCVACAELPPCRHTGPHDEDAPPAARSQILRAVPVHHCLGCGEHITTRQGTIHFPGPNLWRSDLGHDSATFHSRQRCAEDVRRYRAQWNSVEPRRQAPQAPLFEVHP